MFRYTSLNLTLFCLLAATALSHAGEVTLTTYYPSPNGNYDNLTASNVSIGTIAVENQLILTNEIDSTTRDCRNAAEGEIRRNQSNMLYVCDGPNKSNAPYWTNPTNIEYTLIPNEPSFQFGYDYSNRTKFTGIKFDQFDTKTNLQLVNGDIDTPTPMLTVTPTGLTTAPIVINAQNTIDPESYSPALSLSDDNGSYGMNNARKLALVSNSDGSFFYGFGVSGPVAKTPSTLEFHAGTAQNTSPQMALTNTGRLGIGNANPSATLDVNGDARVAKGLVVTEDITASRNITVNNNLTVTETLSFGNGTGDFILPVYAANTAPGCVGRPGCLWVQQ